MDYFLTALLNTEIIADVAFGMTEMIDPVTVKTPVRTEPRVFMPLLRAEKNGLGLIFTDTLLLL